MIYAIISKNDVPTSQMHIYLKNKTGDDGGIYPEIFNDLSITESVNGLYAFATACVITNNFTDMSKFLKGYPSKEVASLALIQYIKGMATTVQLNSACVNPSYENLAAINKLGTAPSLLNLDGDLFYKHYNTEKYFSKEAADAAEDSFPYWVIYTVKEIINSVEIVTPPLKTYELPYYIQNISSDYIPIINKRGKYTESDIIGKIPPSGMEAVITIKDGYGSLASSENAYVLLTDKLRPIKHVVSEDELNIDNGTLKLPTGEFDVVCKNNVLVDGGYGLNNHYFSIGNYCYNSGDKIHIKGLFRNAGIVSDGIYVQLHSDNVYIVNNVTEHRKKEEKPVIENDNRPTVFDNYKYLVIIQMPTEEASCNAIMKIMKKSPYKNAYIDVDIDEKYNIVLYGDNDVSNAIKVKKKILSVFGYKAIVVEYNNFYK
jgi:hypothetical protein